MFSTLLETMNIGGMKMRLKKWMTTAVVLGVTAQVAWADGVGVFGSYWDTKDAGSEIGYGAKLKFGLGPDVFFSIRGSYFEFEERSAEGKSTLEVIPIEAALVFHLDYMGPVYPYVGGGAGYYLMDLEWEGPGGAVSPSVDDEFGWFVLAGIEMDLSPRIAVFGEAKYTWLKIDRIDGLDTTGDNKLDGFGANAGLIFKW